MRNTRLYAAGMFFVTLLCSAPAFCAGRSLPNAPPVPPAVQAKFKKYDSRYYVVFSDLDAQTTQTAILRVTAVAEEYWGRMKGFGGKITSKYAFYFVGDPAAYAAVGGQAAGVAYADRLVVDASQAHESDRWFVTQHEMFHQFALNVIGDKVPVWANEGMADYFGEAAWTGDGLVAGTGTHDRRQYWLSKAGSLPPFRQLLLKKPNDWRQQDQYVQAWAMVYYLQNAKAEDLAKVLTGLPQQAKTATGAPTSAAAVTSTAVFSKNVQIMADKSTNSLIIIADTADYLIIEDVIRKLDITRPMVYLEGLIMEVNANKSFGVGVEWSALNKVGISEVSDLGGTSVGMVGFKGGASIIPQGASGQVSMPSGFSLGVIGAGITIGGVLFPNIGAVLQAYQNDSDVRILSTPQLLTLDNEEAEITVGSNVPYVTRQDSGVVGSTTNYSSYEYKDVGVTLKVTPQINKDGFIRMKLDQSVTKVISQSATVDLAGNKILTPTTDKRTAKTTVVVKGGETVVIGGMIEDTEDEGIYKVPLLGDIPLLGWLFKSRSTVKKRTNLFVFITPRIIQNPEDAGKIQAEKMDYMRTIQEGTVKNAPVRNKEKKE